MINNINEEEIRKIIKRELESYFYSIKEDNISKEKLSFLGNDVELRAELEKNYFIEENSDILVVSELSLKNIFNLSNGIYEDKFEEIIIKQLLEGRKIILIEEGLEHLTYPNINTKLLEKYNTYVKNIEDYGIKIQKKSYFLKQILSKEEVYSEKLLDLKKIKELFFQGTGAIEVSKNTIITGSAMDYVKENNITIVKRR